MGSRWNLYRISFRRCSGIAAAGAALLSMLAPAGAVGGSYVEPAVFASSNGLLDLLMIAQPQPVPSITYNSPSGNTINPVGWVYTICPRSAALPNNQCPVGSPTVSDYGGVRLALQKGDTLKIRLVNRLPALEPIKVDHSVEPGGANLPLNMTNLHTHGLLVEARAPTRRDPTFGDYIFVEIYNSANGTPVPQTTHQHGSIVKDYADYRIDIPANHPSGAFWFHPHVHGLALNQVSSGLAGIITIGAAGDYAFGDRSGTPFPESSVRHLILKDMQVLAASSAQQFINGTAPVVDGEVLNQQASPFCYQNRGEDPPRLGYCLGANASVNPNSINPASPPLTASYIGGDWYFTINGQQYPTIPVTEADGELWRFTNASGSLSYDLQLVNAANLTPMLMQLVAVDGVSIDIPPGTPIGSVVQLAGARFKFVPCPASAPSSLSSTPVCVDEFVMMPSSRAEVWVIYRDQSGNIVTPPAGATAILRMPALTTGPAGDAWPQIDLATVQFTQTSARALVASALDVRGEARTANLPGGIFSAPVPYARSGPTGCKPLAPGHHRRIFFGLQDTGNPSVFGMGYEEVDQNGVEIPGTVVPVMAFDPTANTICVPLGPGQTPVRETWELVNLATENHNFHIHQTRFSYVQDPAGAGPAVMEDNLPLPIAVANTTDVNNYQNGYCTIAQWRSGLCTSAPVLVENVFSQLGQFVYHCHILAHEDGGMMAKIEVVPAPSSNKTNSHDFNSDGKSDIAWRDTVGNVAIWLMDGTQILQGATLAQIGTNWTIAGQRDFNGDGKYDLLWRATDGTLAMWLMNGTQIRQSTVLGAVPTNWSIVGTGDFNGDGLGDILWQDSVTGTVAVWLMNGRQPPQVGTLGAVSANWVIAGTADFNGDGKTDILWRDTNTGTVAIWLLNGEEAPAQTGALGAIPGNWTIVGTGDFNGDGMADILWRDSVSGTVAIWLMNGFQVLQSTSLGQVGSNWAVQITGDYNGDGTSDVLWRASDGTLAMWLMNGAQILQGALLGQVGTDWSVERANAD